MGMKQRVLLVLPHPGTDNFAESLVRTLTEYDFKILAFHAEDSSSLESVWQESTLTRLSGLEWRNLPFQVVRVSKLIRDLKPDVIHTTDYKCAIIVSLVKIFTFSRIPFLLNRHYNKTHHDLNKKHVYVDRFLQFIATCVVVVSYAQKETLTALERCPAQKIHVVHNGVEIDRLKVDEIVVSNLIKEFREISKFSLVAVGRIHSQKDYPTLIESVEYVKRLGYDIHLYICGNTNRLEQTILDKKVAELNLTSNITFLGYVENALNYVSAADIFVQSSMDEAFGVSILEALFLNKRIAITTPAGVIEFVSKFHEFLPPGNPEALGKKIISELDSLENTCLKCTQAQHNYLADNFDFNRTALGYRSVYQNLILN